MYKEKFILYYPTTEITSGASVPEEHVFIFKTMFSNTWYEPGQTFPAVADNVNKKLYDLVPRSTFSAELCQQKKQEKILLKNPQPQNPVRSKTIWKKYIITENGDIHLAGSGVLDPQARHYLAHNLHLNETIAREKNNPNLIFEKIDVII